MMILVHDALTIFTTGCDDFSFFWFFFILDESQAQANREARLKNIVARRQLVDLARRQLNEVTVLRTELERLRMRTFPALVQVDP